MQSFTFLTVIVLVKIAIPQLQHNCVWLVQQPNTLAPITKLTLTFYVSHKSIKEKSRI